MSNIKELAKGKGYAESEDAQHAIEMLESGEARLESITGNFSYDDMLSLKSADVVSKIIRDNIVMLGIRLEAEGYYSGSVYKETVYVTAEDFVKYIYGSVNVTNYNENENDPFVGITIYELDGKHSEVEGDMYIDFYTEEDIRSTVLDEDNSGNELSNYLFEYKTDIVKICRNNRKKYLERIDRLIEITVTIRESKKEKILALINKINNED